MRKVLSIIFVWVILLLSGCTNQGYYPSGQPEAGLIDDPPSATAAPKNLNPGETAAQEITSIQETVFNSQLYSQRDTISENSNLESFFDESDMVETAPQINEEMQSPTDNTEGTESKLDTPIATEIVEETSPQDMPAPTVPTPEPDITPTVPASPVPIPTEQPERDTVPTVPVPTEPQPTEPAGCTHDWQCVHHDEEGHWLAGVICDCGWVVYGNPDEVSAAWNAHSASFPPEEALFEHGGFGCVDEWVVDAPAYEEWYCTLCGEAKP